MIDSQNLSQELHQKLSQELSQKLPQKLSQELSQKLLQKLPFRDIIAGNTPPWVMRFIKSAGKTINEFSMIGANDRVLLGVSGGKDSLALALALSVRRRWLPIDYSLDAVMINWIEHPIPRDKRCELEDYFEALEIRLRIVDEAMHPESFNGDFNCYLCSRNRRRILFTIADKEGFSKIALGHHLDDLVETSMMNLFFRGDFATMQPVQSFFDGKMRIIRPLIQTKENVTARLAAAYDLPVVKPVCPYDQTNIRSKLKPMIKELARMDRLAREHVFSAHGFKKSGMTRDDNSFLSTANVI